jgi:hypothetical protein
MGAIYSWNVGWLSVECMQLYPRRQSTWELQVLHIWNKLKLDVVESWKRKSINSSLYSSRWFVVLSTRACCWILTSSPHVSWDGCVKDPKELAAGWVNGIQIPGDTRTWDWFLASSRLLSSNYWSTVLGSKTAGVWRLTSKTTLSTSEAKHAKGCVLHTMHKLHATNTLKL